MSSLAIRIIDATTAEAESALAELREKRSPRGDVVSPEGRRRTFEVFGQPLTPAEVVDRICCDVRDRGLPAVLEYTSKLDGADLTAETLRVPLVELIAAHEAADDSFLETVRYAADSVRRFQQAILHRDVQVDALNGGYLRQRYVPLKRAGLCVPGGAAAYPSTLVMTAVPAQAAGVAELAVVAPPTPFGAYNTDLLATCYELGVTEVYRMGGAQAVAALALGVEGVPRVDKIAGPGNLFVTLAKKWVFGEVDIDSMAGPSEVVVVADETARPDFVAADLIAQAEHSPGSSILITWHPPLVEQTKKQLEAQLARLPRGDLARSSLEEFGALVYVSDADRATALAERIAPEHLHIAAHNAEALLQDIPSTGAAFLGHYSPVALGDYVAGPSHVLPTGGTARFASGLSANSFLRAGSVIAFTEMGLRAAAAPLGRLAEKEGLTAHAESVDIRLRRKESEA